MRTLISGLAIRSLPTSIFTILHQTLRYGIGIFTVNAFAHCAPDISLTAIIAKLDSVKGGGAVHDVRFNVDNRVTIDAVGEEIARPDVAIRVDEAGIVGGVVVGRQGGCGGEGAGD